MALKRFPMQPTRWIVGALVLWFASTARASSDAEGAAFIFIIGIASLLLVLTPFFVARSRQHGHKKAIFWLSLVLGWTLIGWVIMFAWAIKGKSNKNHELCMGCRKQIKADVKVCVYCGAEQRGSLPPSPAGWVAPSPPTGTTAVSLSPTPTIAVPSTTVAKHRTASITVTKKRDDKKEVIAKTVVETSTGSSIPGEKSISSVDLGPTCPNCGSPGWDVSGACAICAHAERKNLSLVEKDGVIIPVGTLSLRLNQDWAKQKLGEDGIFWDKDWQFSLEQRDQDWVLTPNSASTNDTLVDGVAVTTEIVLSDGISLSVGNQAKGIQKTPLTVRLG